MVLGKRVPGRRLTLAAVAAAWLGLAPPAAAADDRVVVLTSYPDDMASLFETQFARTHPGIGVQIIWNQSREAAARLRAPDQGGIDVYWAPALAAFPALRDAGAFRPLAVDRAALPGRIGAQAISDSSGRFEAFEVAGYGIAVNPDLLARLGLAEPQSWGDLAAAGWAGQVLLPDAAKVGFAPSLYDIILQAEGWERGWALLAEIAGNATLEAAGPLATVAVLQGQAAAGLTIDFVARGAIANGHRLTLVYPGRTAFLPAHVAITAAAPHPAAARAFVDFLLGPEGQALLFRPDVQRHPVRPDAYAGAPADAPNPFARPEAAGFAYDTDLGIARAGLIAALFEAAITRRHARQVALWADLHRAEAALAGSPDAALTALLTEARAQAGAVPVSAAEAADPGFLAPFRDRRAGDAAEAGWTARLEQAQAEAEALVARVLAAR